MKKFMMVMFVMFSGFIMYAVEYDGIEDINANDFPNFSQESVLRMGVSSAIIDNANSSYPFQGGCNGVMISRDLFLTAAHCTKTTLFNEDGTPKSGTNLKIVFNWQYAGAPSQAEALWSWDSIETEYDNYYNPLFDEEFRVLETFDIDQMVECGSLGSTSGVMWCTETTYDNIHGAGAWDLYNRYDIEDDQDFAILRINPNSSIYPGDKYGWIPVRDDEITTTNEPATLISNHGGYKPKAVEECQIKVGTSTSRYATNTCASQSGTSGSPIFDKYGKIAGVLSGDGGNTTRSDKMVLVSPILQFLLGSYGEEHIADMLEDFTDSNFEDVTTLDTYSINGDTYLITLKKHNGNVAIHQLQEDFLEQTYISSFPTIHTVKDDIEIYGYVTSTYDWTDNKWDVARAYTVDGNHYLWLMGQTTSGTNVHINTINSNGSISSSYYNYNWSAGWSISEFFTVDGDTYVYLYRKSDGDIHIHIMNSNGTVGSRVDTIDSWYTNYTDAKFFYQNGKTYLYTHRYSDAKMYIYEMDSDGSRGSYVDYENWSSLYTSVGFYNIGDDENYLFILKSGSGANYMRKINSNGTIGSQVHAESWSSGWTQSHFFSFPRSNPDEYPQNYLLLLKKDTGLLHIHRVY